MMNIGDMLPPLPGQARREKLQKEMAAREIQPPMDAIPLHIQGMNIAVSEQEALGIIGQLAGALQTRGKGVFRNG
jgi:hypothetical protein